eukprot:11178416-Lingulodinium_polyedra.AAC.1
MSRRTRGDSLHFFSALMAVATVGNAKGASTTTAVAAYANSYAWDLSLVLRADESGRGRYVLKK